MFDAELATGSRDIDSAGISHCHRDTRRPDPFGKTLDPFLGGSLIGQDRDRIERNDVDMAETTANQTSKLVGDVVTVIDPAHQGIFEGDPAACALRVAIERGHQLGHRVLAIDRYQLGAEFIVRGVKRDREIDLHRLFGQLVDEGNDTAGRDRHASGAHPEAMRVIQNLEQFDRGRVVVEWLAHTHHDQIGQLSPVRSRIPGRTEDLSDHFAGGQVAIQTHQACRTEGAANSTTDLTGDTNGRPIVVEHEDGFHQVPIGGLVQGFVGITIAGAHLIDRGHTGHRQFGRQLRTERPGQAAHGVIIGDQVAIGELPDLFGPIRWLSMRLHPCGQFRQREVVQTRRLLGWAAGFCEGQGRSSRSFHNWQSLACGGGYTFGMNMTILVIGNGAREHALCWKLRQSPSVGRLIAAPGNPGIAEVAELLPIAATDVAGIVAAAQELAVDLVVIGPEAPLELGLADQLRAAGIVTFGPSQAAAQIETSKSWAKELMERAGVPTAWYTVAEDLFSALTVLQGMSYPAVIKADGLAGGKGVVIVHSYEEGVMAVTALLEERSLGDAGARIVIEECLTGPEVSVFALSDGTTIRSLAPACDHKRAFDGDRGPNTGGMGAFAPTSLVDAEMMMTIEERILQPTITALRDQGTPFVGVLYGGLMLTEDGPMVIEFNARFGDPEAQVILPLIEGDLAQILLAAATGNLADVTVTSRTGTEMVGVVLASGGYPGPYRRGVPVHGLPEAEAVGMDFQAGTTFGDGGEVVTCGGRILTVVGEGATLAEAKLLAYAGIEQLEVAESFFRRDIGTRAQN